jgi:hypothetical protein
MSSRALSLVVSGGMFVLAGSCRSDDATKPEQATYVAMLSGANERPPRATSGTGRATFSLSGVMASYELSVSGLTGPATVAHVLIGSTDATAGQVVVRFDVMAATGTIATGTIDLGHPITFNNTTISGDSLRTLLDRGGAYVNVYTAAYPGGEVRGQILRQ